MDEGEGIGRQKPNKTVWLGAQGLSVPQQGWGGEAADVASG